MAPGPDGTIFVSIPTAGGLVVALLDSSGQPRAGWPIAINDPLSCASLLPLEDGSVRLVCESTEPQTEPNPDPPTGRALAFDANGRSVAGWPAQLRLGRWNTAGVVGDQLSIFTGLFGNYLDQSYEVSVTTVAPDGSLRRGHPSIESMSQDDYHARRDEWAIGPDGIAYGVRSVQPDWGHGSAEVSRITALDLDGARAGWPIEVDGVASGPVFGPDGQIVVTVGSFVERTSHVLVFDRDGEAVSASSVELEIATGEFFESDVAYECALASPRPPLIAPDGTIFVFSEIDNALYALDPSLAIMPGWPLEPPTPLVRPVSAGRADINCPSLGIPAVGPNDSLYLPLQARNATVGGSILAIDADGGVRPGWPVELLRPGAEFWSVVVGSDGTVYALAIEDGPGRASAASIVAIAPDGTVKYTTAIIGP